MKKILVLWVNWMLWNCIYKYLSSNVNFCVYWTWSKITCIWDNLIEFSIKDNYYQSDLDNILASWKFSHVINCIWINKIDNNNFDQINLAFIVNSLLPKTLNFLAIQYKFKLIHFSSDWVFDWAKWKYKDSDLPIPNSLYGVSKYLWEIDSKSCLIIRTSIIWIETNNSAKCILNWFLSLKKWETVSWYSNVYWNGITTLELSKIIEKIIKSDKNMYWINNLAWEIVSKYELLNIINKIFNKGVMVNESKDNKLNRTLITSDRIYKFASNIKWIEDQLIELKTFYNI